MRGWHYCSSTFRACHWPRSSCALPCRRTERTAASVIASSSKRLTAISVLPRTDQKPATDALLAGGRPVLGSTVGLRASVRDQPFAGTTGSHSLAGRKSMLLSSSTSFASATAAVAAVRDLHPADSLRSPCITAPAGDFSTGTGDAGPSSPIDSALVSPMTVKPSLAVTELRARAHTEAHPINIVGIVEEVSDIARASLQLTDLHRMTDSIAHIKRCACTPLCLQVRLEKERVVARSAALAKHATIKTSLDAAVADKGVKAKTEKALDRMWKAIVGASAACVELVGGAQC